MKTCLFCKKETEDSNAICPHCGSVKFDCQNENIFSFNDTDKSDMPTEKSDKKDKKLTCILIGIAVAFIGLCVSIAISSAPCKHKYTEEIVTEASFSVDGKRKFDCEKCYHSYTEDIPKIESVELTVLNKYTYTDEPDESEKSELVLPDGMTIPKITYPDNKVLFDIEIKNVTSKDITNLKGTLVISTKTNSYNVICDFEDMIPANDSIVVEGYGFSTRNFKGIDFDAMTVFQTPPEELSYEFVVSDATFSG